MTVRMRKTPGKKFLRPQIQVNMLCESLWQGGIPKSSQDLEKLQRKKDPLCTHRCRVSKCPSQKWMFAQCHDTSCTTGSVHGRSSSQSLPRAGGLISPVYLLPLYKAASTYRAGETVAKKKPITPASSSTSSVSPLSSDRSDMAKGYG